MTLNDRDSLNDNALMATSQLARFNIVHSTDVYTVQYKTLHADERENSKKILNSEIQILELSEFCHY